MTDLRAYAREAATRAGCDPDVFVRQIQQESGFDPDAYNAGSNATGIAQIVPRWHPDVDPRDPIASLDYAASWMARLHNQYGSYKVALAAYNWGPGNVAGWNGQRDTLPDETRHYLDVILGPAWTEPSGTLGGADASAGNGKSAGKRDKGRSGKQKNRGKAAPDGLTFDASPDAATTLHFRVARVNPDRLNVRAEPSRSAAVVEGLAEGAVVAPLGPAQEDGDLVWIQVRTPSNARGWVAASFLDIVAAPPGPQLSSDAHSPTLPASPPISDRPAPPPPPPPPSPPTYRVNADSVRLRQRPGAGSDVPILTTLRSGARVEDDGADLVDADNFSWRRVRANGQTGWIATAFLSPAATGQHYQFDPSTPTELQIQPWTCSIRSTMWLLKSIGIAVTPAEAQDAMSPRYVNSDLGLLDASGAGIVEVLQNVWGVTAFNRAPVSFDEVAGWAGTCPVAIGGRNWGHWTAVRGVDDAGNLVLANPGGTGPRYGQQTLNRQQFEDLGWFSAVVVPVE